jgi:transposase
MKFNHSNKTYVGNTHIFYVELRLRIFFLPRRAPEMNPDEQVWNEIKNHRIGKQPVENKMDLKRRLYSALRSVQKNTERIPSFLAQ